MPRVRKGDVQWVEPRLVARGRVRRVDARRPAARAVVPGPARGQGARGGAPRRSRADSSRPRSRRASARQAVQPRQAVLARRGDHEGRPARVLPRGRAGARAAPEGPAVHDAPLSRRGGRQGVLPEGRAGAHARLDPDRPGRGDHARRSRATTRTIRAPLVNDELALLWMVNMGCIDMNTWYSRVPKLDRPDFVLFDLDPSEGVGFAEVIEVALLVKEALDALGLASFPKTSSARRNARARPDRAALDLRGHAAVLGDRRRRARPHAPRARHDRVVEGEAARRPDRREPERRGEDDRVRRTRCGRAPARRCRRRCAGTR